MSHRVNFIADKTYDHGTLAYGYILMILLDGNWGPVQITGDVSVDGATPGKLAVGGLTGAASLGNHGAGAGSALPATPQGYIQVNINGTPQLIPFYPA